jgi:hypothetical protein
LKFPITIHKTPPAHFPVTEKKAYTPAEFAALFGREKTWAYRMLYAGKIEGISEYGRMMIPASEADRVAADSGRYLGKKKAAKKAGKKAAKPEKKDEVSGKGKTWPEWVEARVKSPRPPSTPEGKRRSFRMPKTLKKQEKRSREE